MYICIYLYKCISVCVYLYIYIIGQVIIFHRPGFPWNTAIWGEDSLILNHVSSDGVVWHGYNLPRYYVQYLVMDEISHTIWCVYIYIYICVPWQTPWNGHQPSIDSKKKKEMTHVRQAVFGEGFGTQKIDQLVSELSGWYCWWLERGAQCD